jgi:hypothetical protein
MKWKGKINFEIVPQASGINVSLQGHTHDGGVWAESGSDIYYSDGNVGVGASPSNGKFVITAAADSNGFLLKPPQAPSVNSPYYAIRAYNSSQGAQDMNYRTTIRPDNSYYFELSDSAGTQRFIVEHDGNVGVGSLTPDELLTVSGTIKTSVAGGDANLILDNDVATTFWEVRAGRTAWYDQWLLFKNSGESENFTFAISNLGQFRGKDGSAGAPTYTFTNASNYGMSYDDGANEGLVLSTEGHARLRIEDDGTLSVAGTSNYETLVTSDDDIPNKKYVDDNSGVFGSDFQEASSDGQSTHTGNNDWQQKVSLAATGLTIDGKYRIGFSYEMTSSKDGAVTAEGRVQIDNTTTIHQHQQVLGKDVEDGDTGVWFQYGGFYYHTATSSSHTIDLDYGLDSSQTGHTVYIRRARLEIWRVS